jgi:hypothetical protein
MWYHVDDDVDGEKKIDREAKNNEKNDPQQNPIKFPKWSPARAARNRGAESSQGAFITRSVRSTCAISCKRKKKNHQHGNGTASASVAMCEAFFDHAQHTHTNNTHTWDS